ncbi:unnamed protein product [Brassica rapa]|uniref:Transmembrane protein n=2 Tax=Brassica campestris TaxID=3711 RepID=A0A3P6DCU4_BRACM|nr:unnamed protein product [Brassica rapa]VDD18382.1 unnamed protein product [Brassica rapa]
MLKVSFIIVLMLAVRIVSTENVSPAPSPVEYYHISPSPSPSPEAGDVNHNNVSGMESEKSSGGGKKAGIAFGVIAAASIVCVGGYMLKKRRDNIRRSRYEYAATEFF